MDLRRALREQNHDITAGDLSDGKRRYVVRTLSRLLSEEQVGAVIVGSGRDGAPIYLRDLAEVQLGYKKPSGVVRNFSTPCLTVGCRRQLGASVVDTVARIREVVQELNAGVLEERGQGIELYSGLGAVVLGGLVVSTLFTLVLIPSLFILALEMKARLLQPEGTMNEKDVETKTHTHFHN